ncbi:hypothetical protein HF888_06395 [Bermanella marisrubri]|uniref:Uncharacterized protein n=1 Tax=Bermanella marisrubri TaxID=207949 RepID=Q1MXL7_9GAMM|nr:hypothetical protein [Bermanella marisrubri]EAT10716.1 hypothetical protein RED65_00025 [Oceanobacter sp. RED65] [Bermanella marisrubri]QIZ83878.1 hypothetical protein HF888_06395 [Bermanella marisrubri]
MSITNTQATQNPLQTESLLKTNQLSSLEASTLVDASVFEQFDDMDLRANAEDVGQAIDIVEDIQAQPEVSIKSSQNIDPESVLKVLEV